MIRKTQMLIAGNLGYLPEQQMNRLFELSTEVGRILNGLLASIK